MDRATLAISGYEATSVSDETPDDASISKDILSYLQQPRCEAGNH